MAGGVAEPVDRHTVAPAQHLASGCHLVAKLSGYRDIEFGHFTERAEAERYLSALERILRGEGS